MKKCTTKLKMKTKINGGYSIPVESIVNALIDAMENLAEEDDDITIPHSSEILERLDTKTCEQFAKRDLEIQLDWDGDLGEDGKIDADYLNSYKALRKMKMITEKVYKECVGNYG